MAAAERAATSRVSGGVVLLPANRSAIARPVVGIFFPQRPVLKLDAHGYSPTTLYRIAYAAAEVKSHNKAAKMLDVLSDVAISGRHVNRLAEEIGLEMAAQRDPGDVRISCIIAVNRPTEAAREVVAIAVDGGRVLTRTSRPRNRSAWPGMEGRQGASLVC